MAPLRNKRKIAAMARETQEYPRNSQSQNLAVPGNTEDYKAQFFEKLREGLLKNYPMNSAGQSPASWVHCPS